METQAKYKYLVHTRPRMFLKQLPERSHTSLDPGQLVLVEPLAVHNGPAAPQTVPLQGCHMRMTCVSREIQQLWRCPYYMAGVPAGYQLPRYSVGNDWRFAYLSSQPTMREPSCVQRNDFGTAPGLLAAMSKLWISSHFTWLLTGKFEG